MTSLHREFNVWAKIEAGISMMEFGSDGGC
jgi:hypothetical protein